MQIDDTTIYPLPAGVGPTKQVGLTEPPDVVVNRGRTYFGIHHFRSGPAWSPDSRRIALVDCTYDFTPITPESLSPEGKYSAQRRWLAVVTRNGRSTRFKLRDPLLPGDGDLTWLDAHRISLLVQGRKRLFRIP